MATVTVQSLTQAFMENGLLQFGRFEPDAMLFRLNLDMLPSYPVTLERIALEAKSYVGGMNRLVSTADALPLGTALSLQTNIPLVYSRGDHRAPVHELIGAYDIGHPALLLTNVLDNNQAITTLVSSAHKVGLQIHQLFAIIDIGTTQLPVDIVVHSALQLNTVVDELVRSGQLPVGHGRAVQNWLEQRRPS